MPTMSNRIFLSLAAALLCFTVTSVSSYGRYLEYGPRDERLRQVRRCPTCPADCPESLASPWYGSPMVYGQPGPFYKATNENFEGLSQQASYSATQSHPRDSSGLYVNPYFGGSNPYENSRCRCSHGRCNARSPRSENPSPEATKIRTGTPTDPPDNEESFDSVESRGHIPYGYSQSSAASFIPETYREMGNFGVIPTENTHRVGKHYGNAYKQMITDRTIEEESLGSNLSKWNNGLPLPPQPERSMYEGRLKAVETPSRKKVFVVYRADADHTIDDDDLDRSLIATSRQHHHRSMDSMDSMGSIDSMDGTSAPPNNPMSDFQLEQVVRRAIAAATRQKMREEELLLYTRQHPRGIDYNEHERNSEESYNPRRPYNDDLYRRFNAEEAIDRQEKRKQYMTEHFPPSEVVYTPTMRYNPYVLPGDYSENIPSQSISEQSNQQQYNAAAAAAAAAWETQQISDEPLNAAAEDIDEYTSQRGQPTTILQELREISREEAEEEREEVEKNQQEEKESFVTVQDLMPTKRETDLEALLPPPINYRTHSRTIDPTSYPGGKETLQMESGQREKGNRILENITEKEDDGPPIAINPDLIEEMEIPPIEGSEVELQLSFESSDNTTPSPTN